jgi:tetrahydromethanopterin S-methyltransferase subunit C
MLLASAEWSGASPSARALRMVALFALVTGVDACGVVAVESNGVRQELAAACEQTTPANATPTVQQCEPTMHCAP